MLQLIRDLFGHEAWADALMMRALLACQAARDDSEIRDRLHHANLTQRWYCDLYEGVTGDYRTAGTPPFHELRIAVEQYHERMRTVLERLTTEALERTFTFPRLEFPIRLAEAMLQETMHSGHHRAQNARRLRELGGEPPMADYLVWIWKGRPAPAWPRD